MHLNPRNLNYLYYLNAVYNTNIEIKAILNALLEVGWIQDFKIFPNLSCQ